MVCPASKSTSRRRRKQQRRCCSLFCVLFCSLTCLVVLLLCVWQAPKPTPAKGQSPAAAPKQRRSFFASGSKSKKFSNSSKPKPPPAGGIAKFLSPAPAAPASALAGPLLLTAASAPPTWDPRTHYSMIGVPRTRLSRSLTARIAGRRSFGIQTRQDLMAKRSCSS